jgi:hypothetical protein
MRILSLLERMRQRSPGEVADLLAEVHAARVGAPPPSPPAPSDPAPIIRDARRIFGLMEGLHRVQAKVAALVFGAEIAAPDPPGDDLDLAVLSLMRRAARLVLEHPIATQAAFAALVAEGRAFARTDEGARYEAALRRSPAIERSFRAFEMLTGNVLLENPSVVLPSGYLDLLVQAAEIRDLGPYFRRLLTDEDP